MYDVLCHVVRHTMQEYYTHAAVTKSMQSATISGLTLT